MGFRRVGGGEFLARHLQQTQRLVGQAGQFRLVGGHRDIAVGVVIVVVIVVIV